MHNSELIQQILTSPEGKKALEFISPMYDNSYHALWYFQSIGLQLDDMQTWVDDLWLQVAPQTATWGLIYWEMEYGIPTNPELSILERRNTLLATIRTRAPMNPYRIASIAAAVCGISCRVEENTDVNTFDIYISSTGYNKEEGNPVTFPTFSRYKTLAALNVTAATKETGSGVKSPDNPYMLTGTTKIIVSDGTTPHDYALPQTMYGLPDGTADTFEAIAGVGTQKVGKAVLNGAETWTLSSYSDSTYLCAYASANTTLAVKSETTNLISDRFPQGKYTNTSTGEVIGTIGNQPYAFNIKILKSRLATTDIAGLQTWLSANPVTVLYQLATPQTVTGTGQVITVYYPSTTLSADLGTVSASYQAVDEALIKNAISRAKPTHLLVRIKYEQGVQNNFYPAFVSQKAVIVTGRQVN